MFSGKMNLLGLGQGMFRSMMNFLGLEDIVHGSYGEALFGYCGIGSEFGPF